MFQGPQFHLQKHLGHCPGVFPQFEVGHGKEAESAAIEQSRRLPGGPGLQCFGASCREEQLHGGCTWNCSVRRAAPFQEARRLHEVRVETQRAELGVLEARLQEMRSSEGPGEWHSLERQHH